MDIASRVLSIELDPETIKAYIEIKASQDIINHGGGLAKKVYVEKSGSAARAQPREELAIDLKYFKSVVVNIKKLSGEIQSKTEIVFK